MARRRTLSKRGSNPTPKPKTEARKRAEAEYRRERGRIMNIIRRAEKQGYEFEESIIPERISSLSDLKTASLKAETRKLHKIKTKQIRFQALNPTELDIQRMKHDETVKKAKRQVQYSHQRTSRREAKEQLEELRERKRKHEEELQEIQRKIDAFDADLPVEELEPTPLPEAVISPDQQLSPREKIDPFFGSQEDFEAERDFQKAVRKYNRAFEKAKRADPSLTKEEFDRRWRQMKKDAEILRKARKEPEFVEKFSVGQSAYNQVMNMIKDIDRIHADSAEHLRRVLENEISKYGKEKVMQNIAQAPDYLIESASVVLYYREGTSSYNSAMSSIQQIIKGDIPSAQESAELAELADQVEEPSDELE